LVFAPQLAQAKRTGNREYGTLAERYVREFDAKWVRGGATADEPFVGSGDTISNGQNTRNNKISSASIAWV